MEENRKAPEAVTALAEEIRAVLDEKKAMDVSVLHIGDHTVLADYFVIATGTSNTHIRSLAGEVEFRVREKLGIDPIDLRMKNLLRPGDTTIWGQEMLEERGFGIAECLTRVREAIGWDKPLTPSEDPDVRRGKGVACYMYGTGTGYITDGAHCFVQAQPDGSLNIGISSNELGQGFLIAMRQIAADTFGVPIEKVYLDFSDSAASVEAGATVASRTTVFLGLSLIHI